MFFYENGLIVQRLITVGYDKCYKIVGESYLFGETKLLSCNSIIISGTSLTLDL